MAKKNYLNNFGIGIVFGIKNVRGNETEEFLNSTGYFETSGSTRTAEAIGFGCSRFKSAVIAPPGGVFGVKSVTTVWQHFDELLLLLLLLASC